MPAIATFGRATHSRRVALSLVDGFARELGVQGAFPPPLGEVALEIVAQEAPTERSFEPPLTLWTVGNASGFVILDGTYTRAGRGAERFPLADGRYRLRVRGAYYQDLVVAPFEWRAEGPSRVPVDAAGRPVDLTLLPGPAYPLPEAYADRSQLGPTILRGSVFSSSGEAIPGVGVEVIVDFAFNRPPPPPWPFLTCMTGESGDWAIWLPDRGRFEPAPLEIPGPNDPPLRKVITVRVNYPTGAVDVVNDVVLGTEHAVRNTGLRGRVVGPGGRPVDSAQIRTSVGPATSRSRADGQWFLYFDLNQADVASVTVTVTTPDGATASDSSATVKHGAMVVVPPFHVS